MPELLERVCASRNVQQTEIGGLAAAWGNVKAIIVENPRLSKSGLRADQLKVAVPELYKEKSAVELVPTFVLAASPGKLYHEINEFEATSCERSSLLSTAFRSMAYSPSRIGSYGSTMENVDAEDGRTYLGNA